MSLINELASANAETLIMTNVGMLRDAFRQWAEEWEKKRTAEKDDILIKAKDAEERLGVDRSTIDRWVKNHYLRRVKRGGRNWYYLSDVEVLQKGGVKNA